MTTFGRWRFWDSLRYTNSEWTSGCCFNAGKPDVATLDTFPLLRIKMLLLYSLFITEWISGETIYKSWRFNHFTTRLGQLGSLGKKMWGIQFHPEKCNSLSVTRSQTPFHTSYILKSHTLESVTSTIYLGITLSKDMNWDTHINNITSKANKIIGFLKRNLQIQNTEIETLAYL